MAWKPLHISKSAGLHLPVLLISTSFTPTSFTVHLTDLTYLWSEKLDRSAIVARSRAIGTSIDPSDGDQLKIFLEKIKLGLAGGKGTTVALTINVAPDRPSLVLNVSVELPGGLAPLEWPVRLAAAQQVDMTGRFTMPLLQTHLACMQETAALTQELKDKDHVILKLLDKCEEQGTDLGQIWPQAAGKVGRKVDRKKAEEKVKGMATFDLESWRKELCREPIQDLRQLIDKLFSEKMDVITVRNAFEEEEKKNWWQSIKGITVDLSSGKISTNDSKDITKKFNSQSKSSLNITETQDDEDDAFQVQSTPCTLPSSRSKLTPPEPSSSASVNIDNNPTDSDTELDSNAPSPAKIPESFPRSPPPHSPKSTKPKRKLGAIGNKTRVLAPSPANNDAESTADESRTPTPPSKKPKTAIASPSPPPSTIPHRPPKRPLGRIGGKKVAPLPLPPPPETEPEAEPSATDSDTASPGAPSAPLSTAQPSPAPEPIPQKRKLGTIGDKKKAEAASPAAEPSPSAPEPGPSIAAPRRRLGVVGGSSKEGESREGERGRAGEQFAERERTKTPELRETSLERADRKREALKRELEVKARAPVKKKRKF
ncbi:hypothetical protein QTJ16_004837 [Diplocarpon rosae]|uniref:Non-homologous end-joining factor 1 n=1 Tax=Diplocarpon rosae TaxID=946125 RepID=A0AAD9SXL0_9HELO|nr:hypothetical protein QTJ16_004837 [Diplocarpon rosae]